MRMSSVAARLAAISSLSFIAACDGLDLSGFSFGGGAQFLSLAGGDVLAIGPEGFCIDTVASDVQSGFAAIAACASLDGSEDLPQNLAFLTLQVGEAGSAFGATPETLSSVMKSSTAFDNTGSPSFSVDDDTQAALVVYRTSDPSTPLQARAIFDVGQRAAVLTLNEISGAPLSFQAARQLLVETLKRLRSANATIEEENA